MNALATLLAYKMIDIGRATVECSPDATLARLDLRELGKTLAEVIRCFLAGRITEEEALLYARAHWALALLKAHSFRGARS